MTMKRILFITFILSLFVSACSLEENPEGYVTKETFYQTEEQCWSALRSLYTPLHYIYCKDFMVATEAATDLWYLSSSANDATLMISPTNCGVASDVWKYAYKGISRANECIECIEVAPIKASVKKPMLAEARAMRALYYYILTSFMGDVPFYTESVSDVATMDRIRKLPRTSAVEIRDSLYNDLKENALPYFTYENGYKCRANQVKNQHAGYALTLMVMAKMAMWNEQWSEALEALDLIEEVYGEFSETTYPLEDIKWSKKLTDESIFEIQHVWDANGVKFYGDIAGVMTPKCSGDGVYDGVYMPNLAETGTNSTPMRANKYYAVFRSADNKQKENSANKKGIFSALPMWFTNETYETSDTTFRYYAVIDLNALQSGVNKSKRSIDRRALLTLGIGNLETGEIFESLRKNSYFYGGPKFWCEGMTANYDSNNYRIFRYADALLMKAECLYRLNQQALAVEYINIVRKRAFTHPTTGAVASDYAIEYSTDEALLQEIKNERARELGGEFHRKFDLVRWGDWYDITSKKNESKKLKANIRACHCFYPIPETECALSGGVLTNDAYNE